MASCGPDLGLVNEFAQVCMVADDAVLLIEGEKASAQLLTSESKVKTSSLDTESQNRSTFLSVRAYILGINFA